MMKTALLTDLHVILDCSSTWSHFHHSGQDEFSEESSELADGFSSSAIGKACADTPATMLQNIWSFWK